MKYFSSNDDVAWKSTLLPLKLHLTVLRSIDIRADTDISKRSNHLVQVTSKRMYIWDSLVKELLKVLSKTQIKFFKQYGVRTSFSWCLGVQINYLPLWLHTFFNVISQHEVPHKKGEIRKYAGVFSDFCFFVRNFMLRNNDEEGMKPQW